jgi:hypothetical protein
MLIVNGTVRARVKTGGGPGADGSDTSWSSPVPCRIVTNKRNDLGRQNGNAFTVASYRILMEPPPFETGRVQLTLYGQDLGEFSVMYTEYLDAVGAVEIVV